MLGCGPSASWQCTDDYSLLKYLHGVGIGGKIDVPDKVISKISKQTARVRIEGVGCWGGGGGGGG